MAQNNIWLKVDFFNKKTYNKNIGCRGIFILLILERRKTMKNNIFKKMIEKLANANEKNFGGKKLDCCDLNHKKENKEK